MDKIGRNGMSFLCVFGKPYVRGRREPVGLIISYTLGGRRLSLLSCKSRCCIYSRQKPLSFSFIRLRSHFHQNLKPDPLPTKRICLQSHAVRSHFHQNLKPDPLPTKRICLQSQAVLSH